MTFASDAARFSFDGVLYTFRLSWLPDGALKTAHAMNRISEQSDIVPLDDYPPLMEDRMATHCALNHAVYEMRSAQMSQQQLLFVRKPLQPVAGKAVRQVQRVCDFLGVEDSVKSCQWTMFPVPGESYYFEGKQDIFMLSFDAENDCFSGFAMQETTGEPSPEQTRPSTRTYQFENVPFEYHMNWQQMETIAIVPNQFAAQVGESTRCYKTTLAYSEYTGPVIQLFGAVSRTIHGRRAHHVVQRWAKPSDDDDDDDEPQLKRSH